MSDTFNSRVDCLWISPICLLWKISNTVGRKKN